MLTPAQDFLLDRMREVLCEIEDDRARITSVTTMTAGRIGFTAQGEHYTLEIRKGQV